MTAQSDTSVQTHAKRTKAKKSSKPGTKWSKLQPDVIVLKVLAGEIGRKDFGRLPVSAQALLAATLFERDRAALFGADGAPKGTFLGLVMETLGVDRGGAQAVMAKMRAGNMYTRPDGGRRVVFLGGDLARAIVSQADRPAPKPEPIGAADPVEPDSSFDDSNVTPGPASELNFASLPFHPLPSGEDVAGLLTASITEDVWRRCGNSRALVERVAISLRTQLFEHPL